MHMQCVIFLAAAPHLQQALPDFRSSHSDGRGRIGIEIPLQVGRVTGFSVSLHKGYSTSQDTKQLTGVRLVQDNTLKLGLEPAQPRAGTQACAPVSVVATRKMTTF